MWKKFATALVAALLAASCSYTASEATRAQDAAERNIASVPEALALAREQEAGQIEEAEPEAPETTTTTTPLAPLDTFDPANSESLSAALERIELSPTTIIHEVQGEFQGQTYTTTERVMSDPSSGLVYVFVDFTQFSDLLDDISETPLPTSDSDTDDESAESLQSIDQSALMTASLLSDSGPYLIDGDTLWLQALDHPQTAFSAATVTNILSRYRQFPADFSDFRNALDDKWVPQDFDLNSGPVHSGLGPSMLEYLFNEIEILGPSSIQFEADSTNSIRSIEFETTSQLLGTTELHTVTIDYVTDSEFLALPPEAERITERAYFDLLATEISRLVPLWIAQIEVDNAN